MTGKGGRRHKKKMTKILHPQQVFESWKHICFGHHPPTPCLPFHLPNNFSMEYF